MTTDPADLIHVLLVETDPAAVQLARNSFELAGLRARLTVVGSSDAAVEAIRRDPPNAVIARMDVSATAVLEKIRKGDLKQQIPVIVLASSDSDETPITAGAIGADYVFDEPADESGYLGIISAIKFYCAAATPSSSAAPEPSKGTRPHRISGVDLMALPIEPAEAYLLSVLDGALDVEEIGNLLGTDGAQTRGMLRRLVGLGAIRWQPVHPSLHRSVAPPSAPPDVPTAEPQPPTHDVPPKVGETRFSAERKRLVDEAFAMLEGSDHYELLGVPHGASKAEIRESYFLLAKTFHTDTLFGVDLGPHRQKMDRVFQAVTEAYGVLSRGAQRRAYDAYLDAMHETQPLDARVSSRPAARRADIEEEPTGAPVPTPAPLATPAPAATATPRPKDLEHDTQRRKQLANVLTKRLDTITGSARPRRDVQPPSSPIPMQNPTAADRESVVRSLAKTLELVSHTTGGRDRANRLIDEARSAEAQGNLTSAASAMRLAHQWRPRDESLRREAERLQAAAVAEKVLVYEKRARYAEEHKLWSDAALSWSRVADGIPDAPEPAKKAAKMLLEAGGDIHAAVRYARRASKQEPGRASTQRLLAQVYIAAGKPLSAKTALEAALVIEPGNTQARELLHELG